jgi:hypothetical protein
MRRQREHDASAIAACRLRPTALRNLVSGHAVIEVAQFASHGVSADDAAGTHRAFCGRRWMSRISRKREAADVERTPR